MVITNRILMAGLEQELGRQGLTIEEWEASCGLAVGRMREVLQPAEERAINRNIKLTAMHLQMPVTEFLEKLQQLIEQER